MVRILGVCVAVHFRDFDDDNYSYRLQKSLKWTATADNFPTKKTV
jgi:hypothetical protein